MELQEIQRRIETIKYITLLRSARILRRILESWEDLLSFGLLENHHLQLTWKTRKEFNNKNYKELKSNSNDNLAQSSWAVEYTDCTSEEG